MAARFLGLLSLCISAGIAWAMIDKVNYLIENQPDVAYSSSIIDFLVAFTFVTGIFFIVLGSKFYDAFNIKNNISFTQVVWIILIVSCGTYIYNINISAIQDAGYSFQLL